jgi:magnesium-transporting ATPase (P-type)
MDREAVLRDFNTDRLKGLSASEAEERQKQYGLNTFAWKNNA